MVLGEGLEGLLASVFSNALYDLLAIGVKTLRARRGSWHRDLLDEIEKRGVTLDRGERRRLVKWLQTWNLDHLGDAAHGDRVELVRFLEAHVLGDRRDQVERQAFADRLAGSLWEALLASLRPDELRRVRTEVAALHTEQVAVSLLHELGVLQGSFDALGRSLLPGELLERPRRPPPPDDAAPHHLLSARSGVVPFDDRAGWLEDLVTWCQTPDRLAVRLLVGAGGTGKTRLALEACVRMASQGWLAGFYRPLGESALSALATLRAPRLIVVDYADGQPDQVHDLIRRMCVERPESENRARFMLLVRGTGPWGDPRRWFTGSADEASEFVDRAGVITMSGHGTDRHEIAYPLDDRQRLFASAVAAFADHFGVAPVVEQPDLSPPTFARPLFVVMAALLAADPRARDPSAPAQEELLDRILEREQRRHWQRSPPPIADVLLQQRAVGVATLLGADDEDEALHHVQAVYGASAGNTHHVDIAYWLKRLYDGPRWLNPLEPDILGEFLVAKVLDERLLGHALQARSNTSVARALTVLARLLASRPSMTELAQRCAEEALPSLTARALELERATGPRPSPTLAAPLTAVVRQLDLGDAALDLTWSPYLGRAAARLAEALFEQAVSAARRRTRAEPSSEADHLLATLLSHRATLLLTLGRHEEAEPLSSEAVDICRLHMDARPDMFRAALADALNTRAGVLLNFGRFEPARAALEEAIGYRRQLAQPGRRFGSSLATSLSNLSICLARLNRYQDALGTVDEALDLFTAIGDVAQLPRYTRAMVHRSHYLARLGQAEEAEEVAHEAVVLADELARHDATYLSDQANALRGLARRQADRGLHDEAIMTMEQAADIMRSLTQVLALELALREVAAWSSRLGRHEDAEKARREADELSGRRTRSL